jgi:hypothetical protein
MLERSTMAEGLILTNPHSVATAREALVGALPNIFEAAGAPERAEQYRRGDYAEFLGWVDAEVSAVQHGFTQGKFGVAVDQEPRLNPFAQDHGLISPGLRLWKPGDDIPEGQQPGNIVEYREIGDPAALPGAVLRADTFIVQGATFDGMEPRIDSALIAAAHSDRARRASQFETDPPEVVVFTGMRRTEAREGESGAFRTILPPDVDPKKPIQDVLLSEADSALAILESRCAGFVLVEEIGDPQKDHKEPKNIHPELGGRTWVVRKYRAILTQEFGGAQVDVTVVNGEPIYSKAKANRKEGWAPNATAILGDWAAYVHKGGQPVHAALAATYAHLARIGGNLLAKNQQLGSPLGSLALVGNMPKQEKWAGQAVDPRTGKVVYNGGSLVLGEVVPQLRAFNVLLGRDKDDISL